MYRFKETKRLFRSLLLILLVGSIATISSCDKEEEPVVPEPVPATYTIKGQVLSQADNQPLSGVEVKMGALTTTTGATGQFEFNNLAQPGKYTLTFSKEDFFEASYSLEFEEAAPNQTVSFSITVTMVPYVEGVTPVNPAEGGVISIEGDVPVTVTVPAGTVVTDANNQPVTGTINITAVETPDIVTAQTDYNPGLVVLNFEPSGLQFSNPLPIAVENPFETLRFDEIQLEYYNESTNEWEVQEQPITYAGTDNKFNTTINHFSMYKFAVGVRLSILSALDESINVIDSPIENRSITSQNVATIKVQRKSGFDYATPVETVIANAGITGPDASLLNDFVNELARLMFNTSPSLSLVEEEITVNRTIQPNYKLETTGHQTINRRRIQFQIRFISAGGAVNLEFEIHSAGAVTLTFQDLPIDDHGSGGGGSL